MTEFVHIITVLDSVFTYLAECKLQNAWMNCMTGTICVCSLYRHQKRWSVIGWKTVMWPSI